MKNTVDGGKYVSQETVISINPINSKETKYNTEKKLNDDNEEFATCCSCCCFFSFFYIFMN